MATAERKSEVGMENIPTIVAVAIAFLVLGAYLKIEVIAETFCVVVQGNIRKIRRVKE